MKAILTNPFVLNANDYVPLPFQTAFIPPGKYYLRAVGKTIQTDESTQQAFLKFNFNEPGGPVLSKSELISHFRCGLSYGGSNTVQTCIPPIELGTFNGVQPLQGSFEWVGEVTVSVGGYLTLLGAGFTDEEGRVVTVTEAEIELLPA